MRYVSQILHTASAGTGDGEILNVSRVEALNVHFVNTGSPVGTLTFKGCVDSSRVWFDVAMEKVDGTLATSTTTPGYFRLPLNHGLYEFKAEIGPYTSGSFAVRSGRRHG